MVEFALVTPLLLLVALAVLQVTLALHVRATLTAAAAEGARAG
ncbi:MAG: TadE/TadG family type IV pilus assembly protein, partial [Candidatus Nanopelagicales bacterium]